MGRWPVQIFLTIAKPVMRGIGCTGEWRDRLGRPTCEMLWEEHIVARPLGHTPWGETQARPSCRSSIFAASRSFSNCRCLMPNCRASSSGGGSSVRTVERPMDAVGAGAAPKRRRSWARTNRSRRDLGQCPGDL